MGRVVRGGELLVDGVAVQRTAFGNDPLDPVRGSDIRAMLAEQGAPLERIEVYDGETDEDVRAVAWRMMARPRPWLAAGPAALAGELAAVLGLGRSAVRWPEVPRCLVINGSAHPASAAQVAYAEAHGLGARGWRAAAIAEAAQAPGALVIFGGDTARAVLRGFGDPLLHPLGEVLPGVPVTRFDYGGRRWVLITKAGGFGAPDLLVSVHERLNVIETGEEGRT
jgi:uncharacterized protein YgbK (DUF1537 family)